MSFHHSKRNPKQRKSTKEHTFRGKTGGSDHRIQIEQEITSSHPKKDKNPFTQGGRVTLYGRKPVLEALQDPAILPQKLFLAHRAEGSIIREILELADHVGLPIERMNALELSRISKQGKQDQGVALDVQAPHHKKLDEAVNELKVLLSQGALKYPIFLLDGVQTPANLGMILRSLCASGVTAVILPRRGCAPLNPLAVKASAGVALKAPVWHCETAFEAAQVLSKLGIKLYGLRGDEASCLYTQVTDSDGAWVLGNESAGVSDDVGTLITDWVSIPMNTGVESLNAAVAASVVAFELTRRRLTQRNT